MTRGESPSRLPHFSIRFASLQLWEQLLYISSRASTSHTFPFRLMQTSILFKRLYDIPREAHLLETRSKRSSCVCSMFCKNVAEPNSKPENNIATAASHHLMPSFSPTYCFQTATMWNGCTVSDQRLARSRFKTAGSYRAALVRQRKNWTTNGFHPGKAQQVQRNGTLCRASHRAQARNSLCQTNC